MTPTIPSLETLRLVGPEIWLILGMCAVIMVPFIKRATVTWYVGVAVASLALAVGSSLATLSAGESIFSGMLVIDGFSQFFKFMLTGFTLAVVALWMMTSRMETDDRDVPDYLCLLLGAAAGMALMASANNLLMILVATEAASFPSFALAGFRKRHRIGSEGALKYVVFGAASSAVMIYGMSLIYGVAGSLDLAEIAAAATQGINPIMAIGLLAMLAGIAFKLSAVPLHFWCPDVFQGAPTDITSFLSVASKGAAVVLLVRVLAAFGGAAGGPEAPGFVGLMVGVAILGGVTATWGNLVAFHQTNIKRLLAYSSIAHAGYMIMAASLAAMAGGSGVHLPKVAGPIVFYLFVYLFMNLGAFTIAALVAQREGTEDIRDYAGYLRRSPMLCVLLSVFLFSLFGMPGLGGFLAKFSLATAMAELKPGGIVLIAVLFINTLISLYYYLRPIYYMVFAPDDQQRPVFSMAAGGRWMTMVCTVMLVITGLNVFNVMDRTADFGRLTVPRQIVERGEAAEEEEKAALSDQADVIEESGAQ